MIILDKYVDVHNAIGKEVADLWLNYFVGCVMLSETRVSIEFNGLKDPVLYLPFVYNKKIVNIKGCYNDKD